MRIKLILLITLITLNVVDVATTLYGLSLDGTKFTVVTPDDFTLGVTELNPFFSMEAILVKIVVSLVYAGLFVLAYNLCVKEGFSKGLHVLNVTLFGLVGLYIAVVANNLTGIILWGM